MAAPDNDLITVALDAAITAGEIARQAFESGFVTSYKSDLGDVVTDVDVRAEEAIINVITKAFPDHGILAEESGAQRTDAEYQWVIDPLDGTNNFAMGLPSYGVCIGLMHRGEAVLGIMHDSHHQSTSWAVAGEGAWRQKIDEEPRRLHALWPQRSMQQANVSGIIGWKVAGDPRLDRLREGLAGAKRIHTTWSPFLDWTLLTSGGMDAVFVLRNEPWDSLPGILLAKEAGAAVVTFEGTSWNAWTDSPVTALACNPAFTDDLLAIAQAAGLREL